MKSNDINQPLTYEGVSFIKEAASELPYDESKWILSITQEIYEQVPAIENIEYDIELKKTDSAKGYGYGAIKAKNFTIPIIIKDSMLMPLDVFIDEDGRAWPTKNGYLTRYISNKIQNYGKITDKKTKSTGLNMIDRLNAPDTSEQGIVQETPVFASDKSMLSSIFKSKEEIEKIANTLREDPNIIASFRNNKIDSILKIALEEAPIKEEEEKKIKVNPFIISPGSRAEVVSESGKYIVKCNDGKYSKCGIITDVIGFDLQPKDFYIAGAFRDSRGVYEKKYAIQAQIAGVKVGKVENKYDIFRGASSVGSFGCFVFERDGKFIALEPVEMISHTSYDEESNVTITNRTANSGMSIPESSKVTKNIRMEEYMVKDGLGNIFKVFSSNKYNGVSEVDGDIYISSDAEFIKMGDELVRLSENPSDINSHIMASKEMDPVTIKVAGSIVSINKPWASEDLRAGTYIKKASDELSKYYNREPLEKIIREAKGSVMINPPIFKKEASVREYSGMPKFDTVRIAAALSDSETVDKVLSLNFLNSANIAKFREYVPSLRNTLSKLADVLLASRIGIDVPSIAVKTAMDSLGEAIAFLENINEDSSDKVNN